MKRRIRWENKNFDDMGTFREGLRFVFWPGLIYKTKTPLISRQLTTNKAFKRGYSFCSLTQLNLQNEDPIDFAFKHLREGIRFVVWPGLIYKTKTPLILRQLTTNRAFKRGSSFCSLTRLNLQNEDATGFASVGVCGKVLTWLDWIWLDRTEKN